MKRIAAAALAAGLSVSALAPAAAHGPPEWSNSENGRHGWDRDRGDRWGHDRWDRDRHDRGRWNDRSRDNDRWDRDDEDPAPEPEPTTDPAPEQPTQGETRSGFTTGYAIHDNDPAGSRAIAYGADWTEGTIHNEAGGTGTYADPITVAAPEGSFAPGTRLYLPHVQRYGIIEDICATSWTAPNGCTSELDLWIGGTLEDSAADTRACNEAITGTHEYIVNPAAGLPVNEGPIFDSATDTCDIA